MGQNVGRNLDMQAYPSDFNDYSILEDIRQCSIDVSDQIGLTPLRL
jgi:hypothetical protein